MENNVVFAVIRSDSVSVCASIADAEALVAAAGWLPGEAEIRKITVMDSNAITRIRQRRESREYAARVWMALPSQD